MKGVWDELRIAPTTDQREIKRAYAKRLKATRPEDDPVGFRRLRDAYEAALEGSRRGPVPLPMPMPPRPAPAEPPVPESSGVSISAAVHARAELLVDVLFQTLQAEGEGAAKGHLAELLDGPLVEIELREQFEKLLLDRLRDLDAIPFGLLDAAGDRFGWNDRRHPLAYCAQPLAASVRSEVEGGEVESRLKLLAAKRGLRGRAARLLLKPEPSASDALSLLIPGVLHTILNLLNGLESAFPFGSRWALGEATRRQWVQTQQFWLPNYNLHISLGMVCGLPLAALIMSYFGPELISLLDGLVSKRLAMFLIFMMGWCLSGGAIFLLSLAITDQYAFWRGRLAELGSGRTHTLSQSRFGRLLRRSLHSHLARPVAALAAQLATLPLFFVADRLGSIAIVLAAFGLFLFAIGDRGVAIGAAGTALPIAWVLSDLLPHHWSGSPPPLAVLAMLLALVNAGLFQVWQATFSRRSWLDYPMVFFLALASIQFILATRLA